MAFLENVDSSTIAKSGVFNFDQLSHSERKLKVVFFSTVTVQRSVFRKNITRENIITLLSRPSFNFKILLKGV